MTAGCDRKVVDTHSHALLPLLQPPGHFAKVIAQDGSESQLAHANRQHPNVEFQHADALHTGLADSTSDLVTVAQALHWWAETLQLSVSHARCACCQASLRGPAAHRSHHTPPQVPRPALLRGGAPHPQARRLLCCLDIRRARSRRTRPPCPGVLCTAVLAGFGHRPLGTAPSPDTAPYAVTPDCHTSRRQCCCTSTTKCWAAAGPRAGATSRPATLASSQ